jgi:hypothetical protein
VWGTWACQKAWIFHSGIPIRTFPHPSSPIPHPSSLIPRPPSLIPHPSCLIPLAAPLSLAIMAFESLGCLSKDHRQEGSKHPSDPALDPVRVAIRHNPAGPPDTRYHATAFERSHAASATNRGRLVSRADRPHTIAPAGFSHQPQSRLVPLALVVTPTPAWPPVGHRPPASVVGHWPSSIGHWQSLSHQNRFSSLNNTIIRHISAFIASRIPIDHCIESFSRKCLVPGP